MDPITASADPTVLERRVRIAARPATVFPYLVDADRIVRWMGRTATIEPRPGGRFRVDYGRGDIVSGTFREVDPPRRVVFTWGWEAEGDPVPSGTSTVEIDLEPDADGTLVVLRHLNLPEASRAGHAQGWDQFLPRLGQAVESALSPRD